MQKEKIAIVALVIIIICSLSIYLVAAYEEDILSNLFSKQEPKKTDEGAIELGDCADVHYIGKYAKNDTVFDSSYEDWNNKTNGTPLQMFITLNSSEISPKAGYTTIIQGLAEGLVGLKENETKMIGPIPPEKAYGANKLDIGDKFYTSTVAIEMNQTLEVIDLTTYHISLKWIDIDSSDKFTMPQMILNNLSSMDPYEMVIYVPPYYIWENSSEIINITNDEVFVKTTPEKGENLAENIEPIQFGQMTTFIFPDATTAVWDDEKITITGSPEVGAFYDYSIDYYGQNFTITFGVVDITNDTINVSVIYEGSNETTYQEVNRTLEFDRTFTMPRYYNNIPVDYQAMLFGPDLEKQGYSTSELAGESLIFEVEIIKIYKTSQEEEES